MCRHYIHAQVGQALFAAFDVEQLLIVHMIMQCPSLNSAQMLKHKYTYEQNFFEIRTTFHEKTHALTNTNTHTQTHAHLLFCRGEPMALLDKLSAPDHAFSQHPASSE